MGRSEVGFCQNLLIPKYSLAKINEDVKLQVRAEGLGLDNPGRFIEHIFPHWSRSWGGARAWLVLGSKICPHLTLPAPAGPLCPSLPYGAVGQQGPVENDFGDTCSWDAARSIPKTPHFLAGSCGTGRALGGGVSRAARRQFPQLCLHPSLSPAPPPTCLCHPVPPTLLTWQ